MTYVASGSSTCPDPSGVSVAQKYTINRLQWWTVVLDVTNSANATLNISGLGALPLEKMSGGSPVNVTGGECVAAAPYLIESLQPPGGGAVNGFLVQP